MSPNQYRTLERLRRADWIGLTLGDTNNGHTIHRATAAALARRGLAVIIRPDRGTDHAKITTAGVALLNHTSERTAP